MMRRLTGVAFALLGVGCATLSVGSHVEPRLDTAAYRTFGWGAPDALPTGDPRLDRNPFFNDHIAGAVERQLALRGLSLTPDAPDLEIHYHAVINSRLDVNRVDRERGYCTDPGCDSRVLEYEQGTLILDVVDRRTRRVIWRGWAQEAIEPALNDQDRMASDIDEAVRRMIARFPRPASGERR